MRYLLDTGIAQEFIGRNAKVVQRVDARDARGIGLVFAPRCWVSCGPAWREASPATGIFIACV